MTQTTHHYLVTNTHSRCVGILYLNSSWSDPPKDTVSGSEAQAVERMIKRTLRVD